MAAITKRLVTAAFAASLITLAGASPPPSPAREFDVISKTERDFAAMSVSEGLAKSFLAYAAPDGVIFRPTAVPAVETFQRDLKEGDGGQVLDWWPVVGTISRSHDLALSVGPWTLDTPVAPGASERRRLYGYYATVWRKQPDGSWKFVIDGAGGRIGGPPARAKGSPVTMMPVSHSGKDISAEQAMTEVRAAEELLSAQAARADGRAAIVSRLAPNAWLLGAGNEPGTTEANKAELAKRPAKFHLTYQGGGASSAGDLAYTYGSVTSDDPAVPLEKASYIHVWQRQPDGWRIIFQGMKGVR